MKIILVIPFICLLLVLLCLVNGGNKPSPYEVLEEFDFPIGLLPKGVNGYELNRDTGEFSAYLNETCKFPIESYELEYDSTIKGVIAKRRLSDLKGVKVHVLVMKVNIVEVIHDENGLRFSVGITSASFPIDNFVECPQCGCGLDCNKSKEIDLVKSS